MTADEGTSSNADGRDGRGEDTQPSKTPTEQDKNDGAGTPDTAESHLTLPRPGLEKVVWDWYAQTNRKSPGQKEEDVTVPSRVWWIENPDILPPTNSSHLCVVCRHIDFQYLLKSPPRQLLELVPLSSLEQIVQKKECAFCRLVRYTIQVAFGEEELPFEIDDKSVNCQLRVFPIETNVNGPRQLCIYLDALPRGKSIDPSTDLLIYGINSEQNQGRGAEEQKPISMSQMSLSTIKHWYSTCLDGKCGGTASERPSVSLPEGFRLIDVRQMCIVEGNSESRYLALSYVWGHSKTLRTTGKNKAELEMEAGLSDRIEELPKTIKDAIALVEELGERYLWVDGLCITQDDDEDKANQMTAMDVIYGSAVLTIAATSGNNANAGLAGGRTKLRTFTQLVEKVQGLPLANRPTTFDKTIDESTWNTRAWAFQERVLSSRVLFVADQRCFFTCHHRPDAFMESVDNMESGLIGRPIPILDRDYSRNFISSSRTVNILSYSRILRDYTSRQLTYTTDILNAFKGVEARLRPLFRSDLLFGIPRSELDSQILWQPDEPMTRRRDPLTGLPIFPSWSWAGWVGKVRCSIQENLSRIEWIGDDGKTFSSEDCRYPKGASRDTVKRILYRSEWKVALERGVPYYWEVKNPDQYFLHPTAPEDERRIGPHLRQGTNHIVFEAEATRNFELCLGHYLTMAIYSHKCTPENHTVCPLPLRDPDGYIAGYVLVPGDISTKLSSEAHYEVLMISRTRNFSQKDRGEGNPDLLVDSEATTLEKQHFPDAPHINTSRNGYGFDEQRFDSDKLWCLYNIMVVEMKEGVGYRIGVGKMHIDAWAQARPQKKIVVLG